MRMKILSHKLIHFIDLGEVELAIHIQDSETLGLARVFYPTEQAGGIIVHKQLA